jgi:uncharacterized membrane protein
MIVGTVACLSQLITMEAIDSSPTDTPAKLLPSSFSSYFMVLGLLACFAMDMSIVFQLSCCVMMGTILINLYQQRQEIHVKLQAIVNRSSYSSFQAFLSTSTVLAASFHAIGPFSDNMIRHVSLKLTHALIPTHRMI